MRASPGEISELTEHLFRHETGKLVSILTGLFGIERLQLAEDVVQEALVRALKTWPYYGIPKNPAAWLTQAAKNLALDAIRREKVFREKESAIIASLEQWPVNPTSGESPLLEGEIKDDRLRMMFVCCHPLLPAEAQVALALRTLCGFSVAEISRAFLTTEAATAKRLNRAKQAIREARIRFEIPEGTELVRRLDGVLQSLYLLFNEGYKASSGEKLIREEICREAIQLTALLSEHVVGNQPKTHALLALMLLNSSRLPARQGEDGSLLRLQEQDRKLWDQSQIARGLLQLAKSATGEEITAYHLQAGIAACHCAAKEYESTDWQQILFLYDRLVERDSSPVIALNRTVALSKVAGPQAALDAIADMPNREKLTAYYLFYAVLGEFEEQLNHLESAAEHFQKAMELAELTSERVFLTQRLQLCQKKRPPGEAGVSTRTEIISA